MREVKRYAVDRDTLVLPWLTGEFVKYSDYAALLKRCEEAERDKAHAEDMGSQAAMMCEVYKNRLAAAQKAWDVMLENCNQYHATMPAAQAMTSALKERR